jgi:hypothetical protein
MSKNITGILEVDGEEIPYTFRRSFRMPKTNEWNSCIEADYHGNPIDIDDHAGGLEYALCLLRQNIAIKRETIKADTPKEQKKKNNNF